YHTVVVATDSGKVVSGIRVRETDRELIVRDAENRELAIPLDSIEGQKQGLSLMPPGLTASLTRQEIVDLAAFLAALGKLPEFTISPQPIIRQWQTMLATPAAAHQLRRTSYASAATDDAAFQWSPRITTVNGNLPLGELPEVSVRNRVQGGNRGMSFVRADLEFPENGQLKLQLGEISGLQAWLNDKPIQLAAEVTLEAAAGVHRLTIAIDRAERTVPLRVGM
ncbi:MAG: sorbosone dehydrogenase, partial [Planctomycetaceae bacterium]|nr:sorbosone dehydrogenase [Planctomycetaceae bacterium]